ncbi:MAG: hypothetical protein A2234_05055 [Elusimicrobia bacterium RIFOXYA2_FULL_58_8]|nr:MAG: hypothetical protein A2234_05055 [Elusimicrobia bacterium RIFOXYA2_FULL_58_8]OGS13439.1 MAG: hypothetical protein A2285_07280 [Elusimicrobia bacterium RIFOXYA12_FULL_57_11]
MFRTADSTAQIDDLLTRICEELQIPPGKYTEVENRYAGVSDWLGAEDSPLAKHKPRIMSQGSLRIGTTVKPINHNEFDLDLVCQLHVDWKQIGNPVSLLDTVEKRLKAPGSNYTDLVERKNRCVRLNYANEFHMDILPACPDSTGPEGALMVPDREAQDWKASNPDGYANWFEGRAATLQVVMARATEPLPEQESVAEKKPLKLAVQLIKRWRDIYYDGKPELAPLSIVLTTLAAHNYRGQTSVKDAISGILDGIILGIPTIGRLTVLNPTNGKEDFSERWNENRDGYLAFIEGLKFFHRRWNDLDGKPGIHNAKQILEALFGEKLYQRALANQAEAIRKAHEAGRIGVKRGTGGVGLLGATYTQAIPRNTFYGS